MSTNKGIRITTNCVANTKSATNERIVEFSAPEGGGLISFRRLDGKLYVEVFRHDKTVIVHEVEREGGEA